MPKISYPTRRELDRMEPATIFNELLAEAAEWEGGFELLTPNPVVPSFTNELRERHYPNMVAFEVNDMLEIVEVEVGDTDTPTVSYDVVGFARHK